MQATVSSLVLCLVLASLPSQIFALAAISNDNFANAATYSGISQSASNTAATAEPKEPSHRPGGTLTASHSIWWKFTAPLTGVYNISTSGSNFDTVLDVYTGTAVSKLTRLGFNDDANGSTYSSLVLALTKGVTYRIAVDGYDSGRVGMVRLAVELSVYHTARTYQAYIDSGDDTLDGGGMVTFTVASSGQLTGKLSLGARSYPFATAVDNGSTFAVGVVRTGLPTVTISGGFELQRFTIGAMYATCEVGAKSCAVKIGFTTYNVQPYATFAGDAALVPYFPALAPYTAANPCPRAGRYPFTTVAFEGTGYAVAALTVGVNGLCTGAGRLGDGSPITFSAPLLNSQTFGISGIGNSGALVIHVPLYAAKGRFSALCSFDATKTPTAFSGNGFWLRPVPAQGTVFLPLGIAANADIYGSRYTPPAPGNRVDTAFNPNGTLVFNANRPPFPAVNQSVTLSTANVFTYVAPNANLVKLKANVTAGTVSGSVKFTGAPAASPVSAILIHNPGILTGFYGYIPGATGYGGVVIKP